LFLGIGLYLFTTPDVPRTIGEILRQGTANDEEGFSQHWRRVIQGRMSGKHPLPDQCVRALYDIIDCAPQTASSIRKSFTSRLELWANPILDAATAGSDFDLRELRRRPISIYLGVNPKDLHRLQPLMSLFFQQVIALQTDELPEHNPALKHQLLVLLDECPALRRIPILAEASGFLPGYNVRTLLVMQTPAQLRAIYGEDGAKTLLKTLAARIYFAPKDMDDAEEISKELGFTTVKVKAVSRPALDLVAQKGGRQRTVNISEQQRALMLPQEVRDMGSHREIVFAEGLPPILCRKIRYYQDRRLRARLFPAPRVARLEPLESLSRAATAQPTSTVRRTAESEAAGRPVTREATIEDLERIDSLTLDDFPEALKRIPFPTQGRMTQTELGRAADEFLAIMRSP
jgi:type IV secretion system protein VirD4